MVVPHFVAEFEISMYCAYYAFLFFNRSLFESFSPQCAVFTILLIFIIGPFSRLQCFPDLSDFQPLTPASLSLFSTHRRSCVKLNSDLHAWLPPNPSSSSLCLPSLSFINTFIICPAALFVSSVFCPPRFPARLLLLTARYAAEQRQHPNPSPAKLRPFWLLLLFSAAVTKEWLP